MASLAELRRTQLQEASFNLSNGTSTLTQIIIDRLLFEAVRRYSPLRRALPRRTWMAKDYRFNSRLSLPDADAVTESPSLTDVTATNSSYVQGIFPIKHLQAQLDIAKFSAEVANVNGNLYDLEIMGAAKSMAYREEMMHMYGNAISSAPTKHPEWDGLDFLMANGNKIDAAGAMVTPKMLDNMIDTVNGLTAEELAENYFFVMTNRMQSSLNQQFIAQERFNVSTTRMFARDDYGFPSGGIDNNGVDAGIELQSYRGIPLVKSSFLGNVGTMGTVSASAAGSGSQLANIAYYYVVEAVTRDGLSNASAEVTVTPTAGQNVTLTWTTPTILNVLGQATKISAYRIFRGTATTAESLYAVQSARDASDAAVTSFVDAGLPANGTTNTFATFNTVGSAALPDGVTFPRVNASGGQAVQDIFLVPRNEEYCVVPVFKEITTVPLAPVNARSTQISLISDMTLALRAPQFVAKLSRVRYAV